MAPPRKKPALAKAATGETTPFGRGSLIRTRSTRASAAASVESASAAPTPTHYSSGSEYSTPLTSGVGTPATASLAGGPSKLSSASKMEIVLTTRSHHSGAASGKDGKQVHQNNISQKQAGKRKLDEIANSDEYDSDDSPDAVLARKLQEEEYAKAPVASHLGSGVAGPSSRPSGGLTTSGRESYDSRKLDSNASDDEMPDAEDMQELSLSDIEDMAELTDLEGFSDEKISDAEEVSGAEEISDAEESDVDEGSVPARTRQKKAAPTSKTTGKGKGKAKAAAPSKTKAKGKGKAKAAPPSKTKGKGKAKATKSKFVEEDDDSAASDDDFEVDADSDDSGVSDDDDDDGAQYVPLVRPNRVASRGIASRRGYRQHKSKKRQLSEKERLEHNHPLLQSMWEDLEQVPPVDAGKAVQPQTISRTLKPFQLEGLAWMIAMETQTDWKGGLLGDEMGLGKTIQAVSLIMSDHPAKNPSLVLAPPVALMQWTSEIESYTGGVLKTLVYHGTNAKSKNLTVKMLKEYDVIIMSYNSLESIYRRQEKGFSGKAGVSKQKSIIHMTRFHRIILDEAHCIKVAPPPLHA